MQVTKKYEEREGGDDLKNTLSLNDYNDREIIPKNKQVASQRQEI